MFQPRRRPLHFEDAAVAYGLLYGETEYELLLLRGTTFVALDFEVFYLKP
jgi:hypothetical protein